MAKKPLKDETIVFLHGITRSDLDMIPLDLYFQAEGYKGININYPSTKMDLEELTRYVGRAIRDHENYNPFIPMHFVAHSMGGLITRYFLAASRPPNLGKVVMLGTPNNGSEIADLLHGHSYLGDVYKAFFGPAGAQLCTTQKHIDIETEIDYPLGVIAGVSKINPMAAHFFGKNDNDGIVAVESTKLEGMRDHITLPATHAVMMLNRDVMKQAQHFIEHGRFDHE